MSRFEHIEHLYWLGIIPILGILLFLAIMNRSRLMKKYGDSELVRAMLPDMPDFRYYLKFIIASLAIALLVVAYANPQIGSKRETVKREGVDVVIALDVSNSMLAEDLKPNRLERSKQFISRMIDEMHSDRIAIVIFAGNAYLQLPLTVDYAAAKMLVKNVNTNIVGTQGTNIGEAIKLAMQSFDAGEHKFRSLVIITDGENHDQKALNLAEQAADSGVVIHTVGVGSLKGAPIPVYRNGYQVDYKKDKGGSIVLSKLDETVLQQLAASSDGNYYKMTGGKDEIENILSEIASMEKKEFDEMVFTDYDDKFQLFIWPALLLLILEFMLSDRRSRWLSSLNLFGEEKK